MREWRVRQATEIDDVGALGAQDFSAGDDRLEAHLRSIDNLGEDSERMPRQVDRGARFAEEFRQVLEFVRSALEGSVELLASIA